MSDQVASGTLVGRLTGSGPVDTTGPEALSFTEVAQRLSRISNNPITARMLPDDEIIAQMTANGVPAQQASFIVSLASWIAQEKSIFPSPRVE